MGWIVGIDIGGTFTDLVAVERESGRRTISKVLTTASRPLDGVIAALDAVGDAIGRDLRAVERVLHATTLATNTLLQRNGARTALLTTSGFRDVIETGHEDRYNPYNLEIERHPPLVERRRRVPVPERTAASGEIVEPVDLAAVREAVGRLADDDVEAIAVCFLNAYVNDENERRAAALAAELLPDVYVTTSSAVAPTIREYTRFMATTVNAYVGPTVSAYLGRLEAGLRERAFAGSVQVMKSTGGLCTPAEAAAYPVRILESGPAAGALVGADVARRCGESLAIAFDMGGTTAKASLMIDGELVTADELEVARLEKFTRGSGLPLRVPSIDLIEVGVGGGSIAAIDALGLLKVGPDSASADPGPACYGRGGELPTVTDADLVLGYLDPDYFAGGDMSLSVAASVAALDEHIVARSDLPDHLAAAWGVFDLVNENMARAIRLHCVEHGVDPAQAVLVATGGAGPVHAASLLAKLDARRAILPGDAGVASAYGLLRAPRTVERTLTAIRPLADSDPAGVEAIFSRLEAELRDTVSANGASLSAHRSLRLRVRGQAYEVAVAVGDRTSRDDLGVAFGKEYRRLFGRAPAGGPLEIVDWSVELREDGFTDHSHPDGDRPAAGDGTRRDAFFGDHGWCAAEIWPDALVDGAAVVTGPAIVQGATSAVVVPPGFEARRDGDGNLHLSRGPAR